MCDTMLNCIQEQIAKANARKLLTKSADRQAETKVNNDFKVECLNVRYSDISLLRYICNDRYLRKNG